MMRFIHHVSLWSALILAPWALATISAASADDKPKAIVPAAEAKNHLDEECTVEMTVRASKNAAARKEYYLNSEEDFRDEKNLALVISYDDADAFKNVGIEDPADHYKDKMIRVTGKIINENNETRIRVTTPGQIKVVEPAN